MTSTSMNPVEVFATAFVKTTIIFLTALVVFTYHTEIQNYLLRRGLVVPNHPPILQTEHDVTETEPAALATS